MEVIINKNKPHKLNNLNKKQSAKMRDKLSQTVFKEILTYLLVSLTWMCLKNVKRIDYVIE